MSDAEQIAHLLGGAVRNGRGWSAHCPCHEDHDPSLSLHDGDTTLLVRCFAGCDPRDVLRELRRRGWLADRGWRRPFAGKRSTYKPSPAPQAESGPRSEITGARRIWQQAIDPSGTVGEKYLNRRGLKLDAALCGRVLRFHYGIKFGETAEGFPIYLPALIAAFRPIVNDDETTPPPAIHRIFLDRDGGKLKKKMLAPVTGRAVKLDPDENVSLGLGITEGIETGLAVRATGWRPVWALGSAGAIERFEPLRGVECLTIFADNDTSGRGQEAATECARRWVAAGREVLVRTPLKAGFDWLEVLS